MKESEITALAREYAQPYGLQCNPDNVADVIRFLHRRFCLVEKIKATALCRLAFENDDSVDYGLIDGLTDFVMEVFPEQYHQVADNPEIAKEGES